MGMTPRQLLTMVERPLALPSIVAGIRVAAVVGVGTATIAAAIGAGGLGEYIFRGLSMVDSTMILAGAIPAAALALTVDGLLAWTEHAMRTGPDADARRGAGRTSAGLRSDRGLSTGRQVGTCRLIRPRSSVPSATARELQRVARPPLFHKILRQFGLTLDEFNSLR
jgi:ABC-type Fe3+ transport system permease subunit